MSRNYPIERSSLHTRYDTAKCYEETRLETRTEELRVPARLSLYRPSHCYQFRELVLPDPKGGDLIHRRMKLVELLVEVRCDTDVQIVRFTVE